MITGSMAGTGSAARRAGGGSSAAPSRVAAPPTSARGASASRSPVPDAPTRSGAGEGEGEGEEGGGGERSVAVDDADAAPQRRFERDDHAAVGGDHVGHRSRQHRGAGTGQDERADRLPLVRLDRR